jgi:uncharacterized membrane protein YebE (DUF533 family)
MFDATKLLGTMLESRAAPSAGQRIERAAQAGPGGSGGMDLGGLLGGLLGRGGGGGAASGVDLGAVLGRVLGKGGAGGAGSTDLGGLLGRLGEMARQATQDPVREVKGHNPVAVGGLGALAGALLGRGGRGAIAGGVLAVLGSLAYQALRGQPAAANPEAAAATLPQGEDEIQHEAQLVLRAMIQAAQSDGQVDHAEIGRILDRLGEQGEDAEARAFVEAEMLKAPDVEALAREVRSPEQAARVYAASLLAVELDTEAERAHLARLAGALRLPADAVARIHQSLGLAA